jgi:hypothetical protein
MNRYERPRAGVPISLPRADRSLEEFAVSAPGDFPRKVSSPLNRVAFAAAHVVADPLAESDPWLDEAVDWDATIALREHLWDLGFGVAEAMDTAQRGMGMSWPGSLELIRRSVAAALPRRGLVFSGAGTDQLAPENASNIDDVIHAYEEQIAAIEAAGGRIILMASRALARVALQRILHDWYGPADEIEAPDERRDAVRARRQLRESVLAAEPLFRMRPWFLSEQFSLLDAAVAPILWRLPYWGIDLPEDAVHSRRYTVRVFARPSFRLALSALEQGMRS